MLPSIQSKGKKVFMNSEELQEYMSKKLDELTGLISTFIKAGDIYFYALILLPLAGRWYVSNMVNKWLRKKFKALLYT